jgi:hypothetical protein
VPLFGGRRSGPYYSGLTRWATRRCDPKKSNASRILVPRNQQAVQWTPASLSSVRGWYQADLVTGNDGDLKNLWSDSSGSGNDASTSFAGMLLRTGALAGLNVAEFDASQAQNLPSGMFTGYTEGSIFYVARAFLDPAGGAGSAGAPVGHAGTSGFGASQPNTDRHVYDDFLSTTMQDCGDPGDLTAWYIAGTRSKASDFRWAYNGADFFTTATNTVGVPTGANIGHGNGFYNGQVAEIIICNAFLTDADRQTVEGYLAWKWALVDRLPAAHPYKFAPPALVSVPYSMAAATGTFTVTGQAASFELGSTLSAATGTFAISGQAAGLLRGYVMPAAFATFSYTGQASVAGRGLPAAFGSFSYTGQASNLLRGYSLTAAQGAFSYAGQAVNLTYGRVLTASFVAFSYSGQAANLRAAYASTANVGTFVISGQAANLRAFYSMSAATATFAYAGNAAFMALGAGITANAGVFTIIGQQVVLGFISGGRIKALVSGVWTPKPIEVWDGVSWQQHRLKMWTESGWQLTPH